MKQLRQKKYVRVLAWNIFNAGITAVIAFFTETPKEFTPMILIGLNMITKYVNTALFNDLGKEVLPTTPTV